MPKWLWDRHREKRKIPGPPTPGNDSETEWHYPAAQPVSLGYWPIRDTGDSHLPDTDSLRCHWYNRGENDQLPNNAISQTVHPGLVHMFLLPCHLFSLSRWPAIAQGRRNTHNCMDPVHFKKAVSILRKGVTKKIRCLRTWGNFHLCWAWFLSGCWLISLRSGRAGQRWLSRPKHASLNQTPGACCSLQKSKLKLNERKDYNESKTCFV